MNLCMSVWLCMCTVMFVCEMPSSDTLWITVGEREQTNALHDEMLYPTTPSAAPDASARASVGTPQITTLLCESTFLLPLYFSSISC